MVAKGIHDPPNHPRLALADRFPPPPVIFDPPHHRNHLTYLSAPRLQHFSIAPPLVDTNCPTFRRTNRLVAGCIIELFRPVPVVPLRLKMCASRQENGGLFVAPPPRPIVG